MMNFRKKRSALRDRLPAPELFPHWERDHGGRFRFTALFVVAVLVVTGGAFAQKKPKTTKNLKSELRTIQQRKNDMRKRLNAVRGDIRDAQAIIGNIDDDIDVVETRYHRAEDRLNLAKKEQTTLASRLEEANKDFEIKSEDARQRLKYTRMYGRVSFASAIVGAKNVSDLASRTFVFRRIAAQDRKLFEEVRALMNEIEAKKIRSEEVIDEISGLLVEQRDAHAELSAQREVKNEVLQELRGKASQLEKLVRQLDAAENEIEGIINARSGGYSGAKPGRLSMPVSGRLTSPFGMRRHPILGNTRMHQGQDFGAGHGTTIRAAADGVIISASRNRGYGNVIIIDHGGGMTTVYAHCSSFIVKSGRVKRGQPIARVGSTGLSTGPHLHFEVRINGRAVNPRSYF